MRGDASLAALAIATRKQGRIRHGERGGATATAGAAPEPIWLYVVVEFVLLSLLVLLLLIDRIAEDPVVRKHAATFDGKVMATSQFIQLYCSRWGRPCCTAELKMFVA